MTEGIRTEACANDRLRGVVEDLNEWNASCGLGCGADVADTEADGDEKDKTGNSTNVDRHDDCFRCFP